MTSTESQSLTDRLSLRSKLPQMSVIAALTMAAAICEAAIIVAVVPIGLAIASGDSHVAVQGVELGVSMLIALGTLAVALRLGLLVAKSWVSAHLVSSVEARLREATVQTFLRADWETKSRRTASELQNFLTTNVSHSLNVVSQSVALLAAVGSIFVFLAVSFLINPLYALAITAVGVALFLGLRPLTQRSKLHSKASILGLTGVTGKASQAVSLGREIQIYNIGHRFKSYVDNSVEVVRQMRMRIALYQGLQVALYSTGIFLLIFGGLAAVWFFAMSDIEALGAIVLLLLRSVSYGQHLQNALHMLGTQRPYWDQIRVEIARLEQAQRQGGSKTLESFQSIGLNNVGFGYDLSGRKSARVVKADESATPAPASTNGKAPQPVLAHASFRIERGEIVSLVGPSGIGKTTLVHLLLGLRRPHQGQVLVNDTTPLSELRIEEQARLCAFVAQEPVLLDMSVADNIRFFRDELDLAAVVEAAKLAHIHDEIAELPEGYETNCGDRGSRFSGGQRQRISIARALAGKPGLVVLDEPTSALDAHSETAVHASLAELRDRHETAVLVISHREATMKIADRVVTLEGGRIVEDTRLGKA